MKSHINLSLYKSLIESDFLLVNSLKIDYIFRKKKKNSIFFLENRNFLDSSLIIKSIKQLIILLRLLKYKSGLLQISSNTFENKFLVKNSKIKNINSKLIKETKFNPKFNKNILKLLLNLEVVFTNNIKYNLFRNGIHLITDVELNLVNNWGTYKIFNELYDFKKLIFLLILIKKI